MLQLTLCLGKEPQNAFNRRLDGSQDTAVKIKISPAGIWTVLIQPTANHCIDGVAELRNCEVGTL
jgi:hypothetical protein